MRTKKQIYSNIMSGQQILSDSRVGSKLANLSLLIKEKPTEQLDLTTMTIGQLKRYWKKKEKKITQSPSNWMKRSVKQC